MKKKHKPKVDVEDWDASFTKTPTRPSRTLQVKLRRKPKVVYETVEQRCDRLLPPVKSHKLMKPKVKRNVLSVTQSEQGFAVWTRNPKSGDKHWILDASTILKDGTFRFNPKEFKKLIQSPHYSEFKFKKAL